MIAESYPDIEIYIKNVTPDAVMSWLKQHFQTEAAAPKPVLSYQGQSVECLIVPDAVADGTRDGFTSVWFKANQTPWLSDIDCARDAFQFFSVEVRCTTGSWEADKDGWLKIDQQGETAVAWD